MITHSPNLRVIGYSDMGGRPDGVQVMLHAGHAYVGHMFSDGFSVLDVRDPRAPLAYSMANRVGTDGSRRVRDGKGPGLQPTAMARASASRKASVSSRAFSAGFDRYAASVSTEVTPLALRRTP